VGDVGKLVKDWPARENIRKQSFISCFGQKFSFRYQNLLKF
jgi:hypothetical protein